jgi:mono/diheme cytochrome c family protein
MAIHHEVTTTAAARVAAWFAAGALVAGPAFAAEKADAGKGRIVYTRYCVACHGAAGRGDGPLASDLRVPVPDLTTLAARSGGSFPADRVRKIIEGAERLRGHGTADMPAWGDAFKRTEGIEARTPRQAIDNLAAYLRSVQRERPD